MLKNRFDEGNVSVRIGSEILEPSMVTKENIIKEVEKFNAEKAIEEIPNWVNPELIDTEKVKYWFDMIANLDEDHFSKFKDRTIYLNHEPYLLSPSAPTTKDSYENIEFDFTYDQSKLSRPQVKFLNGHHFDEGAYKKAKTYLHEMMEDVKELEKRLNSEDLVQNSPEHADLLDKILVKKYARFCGIKAVKGWLEVKVAEKEDEVSKVELDQAKAMYNDFMVPPFH